MNIDSIMSGFATNLIVTFVGIAILTVVVTFFAVRYARNLSGMGGQSQQIMQTGIPAQAQIVRLEQTPTTLNNNPVAIIHLNVQPPTGPAYPVQVRRLIPMLQITQFQPGTIVPVMIDRADPNKVVIAL